MRTKLAFKTYLYIRKHCETSLKDLKLEFNEARAHSLDERIIQETFIELENKLESVVFYIEDQNSRDIDRHTYQNSSRKSSFI